MFRLLGMLLLSSIALADLVPTAPGPGESFNVGTLCTIQWNPDTTGTWHNVTIDLMSGSNTAMTKVAKVASGLDGSDATRSPFTWPCPDVDLYSAIYFYQFTNGGVSPTPQWTTRFTIASSSGQSVPPPNTSQPDGSPIPWGEGHLVEDAQDVSAAAAEPLSTTEVLSSAAVDAASTVAPARFTTVYTGNMAGATPVKQNDDASPTLGLPDDMIAERPLIGVRLHGGARIGKRASSTYSAAVSLFALAFVL